MGRGLGARRRAATCDAEAPFAGGFSRGRRRRKSEGGPDAILYQPLAKSRKKARRQANGLIAHRDEATEDTLASFLEPDGSAILSGQHRQVVGEKMSRDASNRAQGGPLRIFR